MDEHQPTFEKSPDNPNKHELNDAIVENLLFETLESPF